MSMEQGDVPIEDRGALDRYEFFHHNLWVSVPVVLIVALASLIGTFGNCLILASVIYKPALRRMREFIFIVNLAVADLGVTLIADPMSIVAKLEGEEFFNSIPGLCSTIARLCTISCVTSLMTIAMMSLNRYFFICRQDAYVKIFTKRNCVCICISLYFVGTLLVLLNLAGVGDHSFDRKALECIWDRMATYPYTVVFSVVLVWIPCVVIGLCYLHVYLYVRGKRRRIEEQTSHRERNGINGHRKLHLAKTLFIIYSVFAICWIPYALLIVVDSQDTFAHEIHVYITMFAHLHPSINWLVYYLTNKKFAAAYKEMLSCLLCRKPRLGAGSSTRSPTKELQSPLRNPKIFLGDHELTPTTDQGSSTNYSTSERGSTSQYRTQVVEFDSELPSVQEEKSPQSLV